MPRADLISNSNQATSPDRNNIPHFVSFTELEENRGAPVVSEVQFHVSCAMFKKKRGGVLSL